MAVNHACVVDLSVTLCSIPCQPPTLQLLPAITSAATDSLLSYQPTQLQSLLVLRVLLAGLAQADGMRCYREIDVARLMVGL